MADLNIPGWGSCKHIEYKFDNFFRRTSTLYGASGSGKSSIVYQIMDIVKCIPNVVVVCPTNDANESYTDRIPDRCIHKNPTEKILIDILLRQKAAVHTYNRANNLTTLGKLVLRIGDQEPVRQANEAKQRAVEYINRINKDPQYDAGIRDTMIKEIKEKYKEHIIKLYKTCIYSNRHRYDVKTLTEDELYSLKYLKFNPSLLLIMDDCAAEIKEWAKNESIKDIFFNGRHWWITSIYTFQDDSMVEPPIRKNTFNAFFTESGCAMTYFNRKSNGFTPQLAKRGMSLAEKLFNSGEKHFRKMVYSRMDMREPLRYIQADSKLLTPFRIGCKALWKLCEKIPEDKVAMEAEKKLNPFYSSFMV